MSKAFSSSSRADSQSLRAGLPAENANGRCSGRGTALFLLGAGMGIGLLWGRRRLEDDCCMVNDLH